MKRSGRWQKSRLCLCWSWQGDSSWLHAFPEEHRLLYLHFCSETDLHGNDRCCWISADCATPCRRSWEHCHPQLLNPKLGSACGKLTQCSSLRRFVLSAASCPVVMSFVSSRLNSRCWLRSRTPSRLASPGLWALPVLVAPLLLPTLVHPRLPLSMQRPQRLRWCLRPVTRWQPLCCALRLSGLHPLGPALAPVLLRPCPNVHRVHRVAVPALPLACVDRLLSRSRDWLRTWPPRVAHRSRLPSCAFPASLALSTLPQSGRSHLSTPLDPLHPLLRSPRPLVSRSLRLTPTTYGTHSSTHTASPHLLVAPRPPSPSRPKPLELVGLLATSVVVSAKPPSAPCGGTFDLFPLLFCALLPGAASLVGSFWARAHFRGSCGCVGPCGPLLRLLSSTWALSSVVGAGSGVANSSASLKIWRTKVPRMCGWYANVWYEHY